MPGYRHMWRRDGGQSAAERDAAVRNAVQALPVENWLSQTSRMMAPVPDLKQRLRRRHKTASLRAIEKHELVAELECSPHDTLCSICYDDYKEGEPVRLLRCSHYFHISCIDKWLLTSLRRVPACPLCNCIVAEDLREDGRYRWGRADGRRRPDGMGGGAVQPDRPLPRRERLAWWPSRFGCCLLVLMLVVFMAIYLKGMYEEMSLIARSSSTHSKLRSTRPPPLSATVAAHSPYRLAHVLEALLGKSFIALSAAPLDVASLFFWLLF
eukprot:CAMPEP_0115843006 /NCGR_PEP_ID=MMETSP0287-20121206/8091_1 /TAXON_ID=412157 /ORGANISM="Chrysochromulina rotalis, Strain UIO044" /LENGTH=267 /DNA_ID=CAMNT_0003296689 /DNA_START=15 /DNA_END=818 /DNA_ORIENTATION=+